MEVSYAELYFEGEGVYAPSIVTDGDRTVAVYERLPDGAQPREDAVEVGNNDLHRFYVVHLGGRDDILSDGWRRDPIWLPKSGMINPSDAELPTVIWWRGEGYYQRGESGEYSKTDCNRGQWVTVSNLAFFHVVAFNDGHMSFAFVPSEYGKAFMRRERVSKNTGKFLGGALAAH